MKHHSPSRHVHVALTALARLEGVKPTNSLADRTIRHAVVWRKSSQGTDSASGSRLVERMLTTVQTLRLQTEAQCPGVGGPRL